MRVFRLLRCPIRFECRSHLQHRHKILSYIVIKHQVVRYSRLASKFHFASAILFLFFLCH
jgi:hypothetical protein